MTKFEEELKNKGVEIFTHMDGCTISKKVCINYADVVNLSEGWVSPEEHQARVNELIEAKEKKIKQLRKINHLYKKAKENAERLAVDRGERFNQAQDELASLESQLQQQALPVVPEDVDKAIKYLEKHNNSTLSDLDDILTAKGFSWLNDFQFKDRWFGVGGLNNKLFILSHLAVTGYQVEKPHLFRLKLKNTPISNYYLWLNHATGKVFVDKKFLDWTNHDNVKNIFTEQEIAKISDGAFVNNKAFELVPVEDGE